jgi:hypothetical protein
MGRRPGESDDGGQGPAVVLVLRSPAGLQPVGQPVAVGVEVRNLAAGDVWMVGVIDGSEEGLRYPHYRPSVTRNGVVVAAPPPPEDPLIGPLRVADFRRLGPGEAFDPTRGESGAAYLPLSTFASFRPAESGAYSYTLTLSTESGQPEEWLGRFGQDAERTAVLDLVARVPRVTVTSKILEVEVR